MYRKIKFSEESQRILEQLQRGAFLTVKSEDKVNTMTIAWGSIGYMWNKPVFISMVRYSRYTYELIENTQDFTVSFPLEGKYKSELAYFGTKSGRDVDKYKECNVKLKNGENVNSPFIDDCDIYIECKIVYKQPMDENMPAAEIQDRFYKDDDYHVLYYGEILGVYVKEE